MMETSADVVLVGGGHAHIQVMTDFSARPEPGLRLILVSSQRQAPYSGMLPGYLAGFYRREEMHIDLAALAAATRTKFILARAVGIDLKNRQVICDDGAKIAYRFLSLNTGITPDLSDIAGAERYGIPVKPIGTFLDRFDAMLETAATGGRLRNLAVVGNGAAGVELAFALSARLSLQAGRKTAGDCKITLIGSGPVVETLNRGVRHRIHQALDRHGIVRRDGVRIVEIERDALVTERGERIATDQTLISTRARPPLWFGSTGLALTPDGSVATAPTLQAIGHDDVFAVGDCAAILGCPREKAGVFAVRQGPVLARNIRLRWRGAMPATYHPQTKHLVILMTADGRAIAGRGRWLTLEGRWVWWLKRWIDRRFMKRFKVETAS